MRGGRGMLATGCWCLQPVPLEQLSSRPPYLSWARGQSCGFGCPFEDSISGSASSRFCFLEVPRLCPSTSCIRCGCCGQVCFSGLSCSVPDSFFTPGGAPLSPREATWAPPFGASACPSVTLGMIFLGHMVPV